MPWPSTPVLVGRQVAPVRRQSPGRATPLDLQPGEVLLGVPGQDTVTAARRPPARRAASHVQAQHGRLVLQRAVRHQSVDVVQADRLDGHGALLDAVAAGLGMVVSPVARKIKVCWSLTPGEFQVPISSSQLRRLEPGLLGQLAPSRGLGRLAVLVAGPRRDLEHQGVDRRAVLAHQRHRAVVVHGHDGDGAGVADHEAFEGRAVGVDEVEAVHPEQPGPEELLLRDTAEPGHAA